MFRADVVSSFTRHTRDEAPMTIKASLASSAVVYSEEVVHVVDHRMVSSCSCVRTMFA